MRRRSRRMSRESQVLTQPCMARWQSGQILDPQSSTLAFSLLGARAIRMYVLASMEWTLHSCTSARGSWCSILHSTSTSLRIDDALPILPSVVVPYVAQSRHAHTRQGTDQMAGDVPVQMIVVRRSNQQSGVLHRVLWVCSLPTRSGGVCLLVVSPMGCSEAVHGHTELSLALSETACRSPIQALKCSPLVKRSQHRT